MKSPRRPANGGVNAWPNACNNSLTDRARFSPLRQRKRRRLTLRSEFGDVELLVDYGQHPASRQWVCPLRQHAGLGPHQKLTPGYAAKLCFTVTATGSYEDAAQVASQWSHPVDDATLHALVQRVGARAEAQTVARLATPPVFSCLGLR